jgi:SSS family solute:Na+ symporter
MTLFWPEVCRRSHATWTLLMTITALGLWLVFPQIRSLFLGINLPHPIYFCWMVSLVTFVLVAVLDKRRIKEPAA